MERFTKLKRLFRFDDPSSGFELLETEHGEPGFWGGWRDSEPVTDEKDGPVESCLAQTEARWKKEFRAAINQDLIFRRFLLGGRVEALAVFINGMANAESISDFIIRPGMRPHCLDGAEGSLAEYCLRHIFTMQEAESTRSRLDARRAVLDGQTALYIEGCDEAILMDTRGFPKRSVGTPQNEVVVLGPHEAFTENIRDNISLLRRIIRTDDFVCEFRASGGRNNNRIAIAYRQGVANPSLVHEVKRRFANVDTLMVLSTGMLEQLTEKHPFTPLPQSLSTERPDRAAAQIMQGRVAVLLDGSPLASVMPATLFLLMSAGGDVYLRQPIGALVRVIRYIGAFLSIIMPAHFLALAMHHQGMLSGEVLATVISSRNMVFLPLGVEMLFLLVVFQLVREAGLAVPGAMGQSIGIIGGLVLGQAAVAANIVSRVVLIIVALTGLGNFAIPDYGTQLAAAYYRIFLVIAAWIGGLLGLTCAVTLTVAYLASLKSYGVPFLTPASPKTYSKGPSLLRGVLRNSRRPTDEVNAGAGA